MTDRHNSGLWQRGTLLMDRCWLFFLGIILLSRPIAADAQHCHGGFGFHGFSQSFVVNPGLGYSGYYGPIYSRSLVYRVGDPSLYQQGLDWPQPVSVFPGPVANATLLDPHPKGSPVEPSQVPVVPSSPAARLKSLDLQARGDQRLRQQKWSEARAAYRSAVDAAPDRAEGHLRLALCLVVIQRFDSAIHEFKRALFIDPQIPQLGKFSKALFGPDSQLVRTAMISKLTDWVREDYTNPDRLFLMGVILHFEGDTRGREFFEAALRMKRKGDTSHLGLFINQPGLGINDPNGDPIPAIPKLNDKPMPILPPPAKLALPNPNSMLPVPGAPVPMPDL